MMARLDERVAIVTGGATGIGRACVDRPVAEGARVLFTDVAQVEGRQVLEQLRARGADAEFLAGDVRERLHASEAAALALARWGRIDILVANAGLQAPGRLLESTESDWDTTLSVNLLGMAWSCQAVLPAMLSRGGG